MNTTKFYTSLCFLFVFGFLVNSQAQILVQDTTKNKNFEIDFGNKIYYKLYSDSVLGIDLSKDYSFLISSTDSSLILSDEEELLLSDIKYLEVENKSLKKWRGISAPFLIAGIGIMTKGITMLIGEGTESKNEELVPIYLGTGATITAISSIPFFKKNKSFDFTKKKFQILTP